MGAPILSDRVTLPGILDPGSPVHRDPDRRLLDAALPRRVPQHHVHFVVVARDLESVAATIARERVRTRPLGQPGAPEQPPPQQDRQAQPAEDAIASADIRRQIQIAAVPITSSGSRDMKMVMSK